MIASQSHVIEPTETETLSLDHIQERACTGFLLVSPSVANLEDMTEAHETIQSSPD
jgi:hypothetical protein